MKGDGALTQNGGKAQAYFARLFCLAFRTTDVTFLLLHFSFLLCKMTLSGFTRKALIREMKEHITGV